jgi:hypothetical protein
MTRRISQGRKATYYVGAIIMVIGGLMFFSTFVTFAMHFGDFANFDDNAKSDMFRAFGGIALLILGGIIMNVGRAGLAGSGAVLDPKQETPRQSRPPARGVAAKSNFLSVTTTDLAVCADGATRCRCISPDRATLRRSLS